MRRGLYRQPHESSIPFIPSASPPAVRQAWIQLLSRYQWQCFATLTWRTAAGREQVERDFKTWVSRWMGNVAVSLQIAEWHISKGGNVHLRGHWPHQRARGRENYVWVLGIEPHRTGRLHAHALIKFPDTFGEVRLSEGWELWKDWHGLARLEPPRGQDDAVAYVSKYVIKGRSELVFSPSFNAPAGVSNSASS